MTKLTFENIAKSVSSSVIKSIIETHYLDEDEDFKGSEITPEKVIGYLFRSDLNLEIAQKEGASIRIEDGYITIENPAIDIAILQRIAELSTDDEEEHMELFKKHGLFHDGGDDFDYSGTWYYDLIEVLRDLFRE